MSSENTSDIGADAAATAALILVFHKIQSKFSFGSTNFSPRRFDKLLVDLKKRGYCFQPLESVVSDPGQNRVALTFDDGYEHLREVLPVMMEKFAITPRVFIPAGCIGQENRWDYSYVFQRSRHLSESSIKELAALGVEFASHGHSHQPLIRLSNEKLADELKRSKKRLEDITGKPVTSISYPFGRVNERVIEAAAETGYAHGFTMSFPVTTDHRMAKGRLAVYGFDTLFTIRQKISGGRLYAVEKMKAALANRLSAGTGIYRRLSGR